MLIRGQFIEKNERSVIHGWSLFVVPDYDSLSDVFQGILSKKYSCGREMDFENFNVDEVVTSIASAAAGKPPSSSELMPAPLSLRLHEIKETNSSLFIQYELKRKLSDPHVETSLAESIETPSDEPLDTITNALMNRQNSYVSPKENTTHRDVQQFNAIVSLVKDKKCGVRPTSLDDFAACLQ